MSMAELQLIQERDAALRDARTDYLTGLLNRRGLDHATRTVEGNRGYYVTTDLNGFKRAQDEHPEGHEYGDAVLRTFGHHLRSITRQSTNRTQDPIAARTGGDEFVVACSSSEGAQRICAALRGWSRDGITASVGWGVDLEDADMMMYDDKMRHRDALEDEILGRTPISTMLGLACAFIAGMIAVCGWIRFAQ